jgi:hypothetical protein
MLEQLAVVIVVDVLKHNFKPNVAVAEETDKVKDKEWEVFLCVVSTHCEGAKSHQIVSITRPRVRRKELTEVNGISFSAKCALSIIKED